MFNFALFFLGDVEPVLILVLFMQVLATGFVKTTNPSVVSLFCCDRLKCPLSATWIPSISLVAFSSGITWRGHFISPGLCYWRNICLVCYAGFSFPLDNDVFLPLKEGGDFTWLLLIIGLGDGLFFAEFYYYFFTILCCFCNNLGDNWTIFDFSSSKSLSFSVERSSDEVMARRV